MLRKVKKVSNILKCSSCNSLVLKGDKVEVTVTEEVSYTTLCMPCVQLREVFGTKEPVLDLKRQLAKLSPYNLERLSIFAYDIGRDKIDATYIKRGDD